MVDRLGKAELLNVLAKLDKLLDKNCIGYIVIGSLADYLLGIHTVSPSDIDILVSREDLRRLSIIVQQEQSITLLEPVEWREASAVKGFHGRTLLDGILVDIMAEVRLKHLDKWILFAYERLLPCTIEVKPASTMTVRIPCPEIQAIANRALSRLDRARAIENIVLKKRCSIRVNRCLSTVSH